MKAVLTHAIAGAIGLLIGMLMMSKCTSPTIVERTETRVDTVYNESVVTVVDTVKVTKWKTKYDTLYAKLPVPIYINSDTTEQREYSYNKFYDDSTTLVSGNMLYKGSILRHDQMLIKLKDELTFIPTTTTIIRDKEVLLSKTVTRVPRFSVGAYAYFDGAEPQSGGVSITMMDNKFRQYTIGKDVLNTTKWMVEYRHPLFYSKKR